VRTDDTRMLELPLLEPFSCELELLICTAQSIDLPKLAVTATLPKLHAWLNPTSIVSLLGILRAVAKPSAAAPPPVAAASDDRLALDAPVSTTAASAASGQTGLTSLVMGEEQRLIKLRVRIGLLSVSLSKKKKKKVDNKATVKNAIVFNMTDLRAGVDKRSLRAEGFLLLGSFSIEDHTKLYGDNPTRHFLVRATGQNQFLDVQFEQQERKSSVYKGVDMQAALVFDSLAVQLNRETIVRVLATLLELQRLFAESELAAMVAAAPVTAAGDTAPGTDPTQLVPQSSLPAGGEGCLFTKVKLSLLFARAELHLHTDRGNRALAVATMDSLAVGLEQCTSGAILAGGSVFALSLQDLAPERAVFREAMVCKYVESKAASLFSSSSPAPPPHATKSTTGDLAPPAPDAQEALEPTPPQQNPPGPVPQHRSLLKPTFSSRKLLEQHEKALSASAASPVVQSPGCGIAWEFRM
jgi:hypothetical protein